MKTERREKKTVRTDVRYVLMLLWEFRANHSFSSGVVKREKKTFSFLNLATPEDGTFLVEVYCSKINVILIEVRNKKFRIYTQF